MKLRVNRSKLSGSIAVPGSKSHTIRAAALAMMAEGVSHIRAPLVSEDALSALNAARAFGAQTERGENDAEWIVKGCAGKIIPQSSPVDMGDSGTSIKIFAALAALSGNSFTFDGDASLRSRPMSPLLDALAQAGAETSSSGGRCPFTVKGPIRGGRSITVNGKSSQYVSAMLFALPCADGDSVLDVTDINEQPYIGITLAWLDRLGIRYKASGDLTHFEIPGNQKYRAFDAVMPADFSTACFPLAASAVTGCELDILNLDFSDAQGDKAVFGYLEKMGVSVKTSGNVTKISRAGHLAGADLDLNATPDALPAVAAVAAFTDGVTRIRNVAQARIKETDRIACMTRELAKMGASIVEHPDGMDITGGHLHGAVVDSHRDHRIAMALAVAGLAAEGETVILDAECAAVTYPGFFSDFIKLGADFRQE